LEINLTLLEKITPYKGQEDFLSDAIAITQDTTTFIKKALAQTEQEPVCDKDPQGCWNVRCQLGKKCKNTPPAAQRTWGGLTDEEIMQIWGGIIKYETSEVRIKYFARAIESKMKEINT
jgi:hypothetical protein